MIPFTKPSISKVEENYVLDALQSQGISGDKKYTRLVYMQFAKRLNIQNMLLTTSGTAALEMAALLIDIKPGDEVIVPSFTFSSTVNAFSLRGAIPVFCDIRTDTMNMDEALIEGLITNKTKAICTVDYAGVPCEMDTINQIAKNYSLFVVEDAAQAVGSYYREKPAGTLSDFGCFSFHETKNYVMGEGGALVINNKQYMERAEIIREKGTNRRQLLRGLVDKYTWHEIGSSYLPSDVLAALLYAQMERFDEIMAKRVSIWNTYHEYFANAEYNGILMRPHIPAHIQHNAHMYYIVLQDNPTREGLITALKSQGISACFHYIPLHSAPVGVKMFNYTANMLPNTEEYAARLLRLPLYADMTKNEAEYIAEQVLLNA